MLAQQSFLGFVLFLSVIFLPGSGFVELVGLGRRCTNFSQRLALAFAFGLAVDTAVFAARAYGPMLLGFPAGGVDLPSVFILLLLGAGLALWSLARKQWKWGSPLPTRADLVPLSLVAALGVLFLLYLNKYPIFPEYPSADFYAHASNAEGLASGPFPAPQGILYSGVSFQLASALLLVGGEGVATVRDAMAVLVALSPLLFYLAAAQLFRSERAGQISAAVYALSGPIWYLMVFDTGLYPNFFGVLASLLLIVALVWVVGSPGDRGSWLAYLVALSMAYLSHYTTVTILPALLVLAVWQLFRGKGDWMSYSKPAIAAALPLAAAVLLSPSTLPHLLQLALAGGGSVNLSTPLSGALAPVPVLGYLAALVYDDVGLLALFFFAGVSLYAASRSRRALAFLPALWLASLLVAAPDSISAWRFSIEALVPLMFMAGYGVDAALGRLESGARAYSPKGRRLGAVAVALLLVSPLVVGGWGEVMLADSVSSPAASATSQYDLSASMNWLKGNTPSNSTYLSVTDWRMTYTGVSIGRPTLYRPLTDLNCTLRYARAVGAGYVIVTRQVPAGAKGLSLPWYTFQNGPGFREVYGNADVRVYQVG